MVQIPETPNLEPRVSNHNNRRRANRPYLPTYIVNLHLPFSGPATASPGPPLVGPFSTTRHLIFPSSRNSDRICWQPTETAYAYERWKLWRGGKGVSFSSHGAVKKGRQVENITRKGLLDDRVG
ncbi:LOW QUALITY PROTEIN: hypothetical protein CH63R_12263 [Colletotrichum higginsianum IMI 349063]|uniref:Uncharacterized protein n=1 Tax=Colletotrichum higginsianum (strain IMI 349063) TaxID=759273 RepID=A0A1B7Y0L5_COLHI|nr:LOW QUALITY PROTEIN: hypothetical protein CH63R_12263 [Colletotrichum higginsianum IMI 349063]OBR05560.1 LOW QUALITY PROTEIN: hypothetical protein CH63R_12263 [Colletotrichum higginsianum IMI 349063]